MTDVTPPAAGGELGPVLADLAFAQAHDHALVELAEAASARGESVPDRAAATFVTWAVRAVGARRVVELGAGAGALTWWLAGAVGDDGEVHACTDPASAARLEATLRRSGRFGPVTLHLDGSSLAGASPDHLADVPGDLDAIVVNVVTAELLGSWTTAVERLRPGGVLLVAGVLADGTPDGRDADVVREALEDPELWTSVVPLGDGWLAALKARSDLAGGATDELW